MDLVMQVVGLLLLLGGLWLGYRRWVAPLRPHTGPAGQALLMFVLLTMLGGLIGGPFWWLDDPRTFSWDLPPLAGRMLGAAGLTFALLGARVLQRPSGPRLRLVAVMVAVYLAPLVAAILALHLGRFDFGLPITYGFFIIAVGMTLPALYFALRPPPNIPSASVDTRPAAPLTSAWLVSVGAVTLLWGLALFITDSGPLSWVWVWPGDLRTSQLIGVMLLAIAAGCAFSMRSADLARLMLIVLLTYALGIVAASLWGAIAGQPTRPSYAIAFGIIALGSGVLLAGAAPGSGGRNG